MAGNKSTGGIPQLLYSESVSAPLLTQGQLEYGANGINETSDSRDLSVAINTVDDPRQVRYSRVAMANLLAVNDQNAVDESGTVISPKAVLARSTEVPGFHEFVPYLRDTNRTKYEEAALYVREGIDNEKFASHPNGRYSKIAFNIVHHPLFYLFDLLVTCLLLSLAIIEDPSLIPVPSNRREVTIVTHSVLEMIFLSIIGLNILLKFVWMKPRTFLRQRTTIAAIIMIVMFIEAMVVLVRQDSHFRVTRCLRPIFFIDTYVMVGVRRVLRQIIQCLKPILDVIVLLFFMVAIFALMGYYLFADVDPTFFSTYLRSFVSLFITLTTANHPDVFMEAYVKNRASPLFFIVYLFVTLYFFSSVLLAVVYAHFNELEKKKFRKLFLHKREALRLAFYVLGNDGEGVNFHDFMLFMFEYKPRIPEYHVMCIFKALQKDPAPQESLCLEEFYNFYEMQNLQWKKVKGDGENYYWYDNFSEKIKPFFAFMHRVTRFKYFNSIMAFIVLCNALYLILFALITSYACGTDGADTDKDLDDKYCDKDRFKATHKAISGSFIFTGIYIIEITIRILADGPADYFRKWWNRFDSVVILLSFILLCLEAGAGSEHSLTYLTVFRPVKLIRLLRLKRRYYDIMNTVFFLSHRLFSVLLLLVVIFYFYAIIGMEIFQGKVFVGCCDKALFDVGSNYESNASHPSAHVYWLNNFDNIYQSYVILYEEMIVNNWFVQMEGFVSETNVGSRLFFFAFWVTTVICLSVIIAYIVDAFVFRIQASQKKKKCSIHPDMFECRCREYRKKRVEIILRGSEINQLKYEITLLEETRRRHKIRGFSLNFMIRTHKRIDFDLIPSNEIWFTGKRLRTKEDLNLEMHRNELKDWIYDREQHRRELQENPEKEKSLKHILWVKTKEVFFFLLE